MVPEVGEPRQPCVLVTHIPPDRQQVPKSTYFCKRNVVTPYRSLRGQQAARSVHGGAGLGTRKKRTPSCNRVDRGCDITSRESGQTSLWSLVTREFVESSKRRKANECCDMGVCTLRYGMGQYQLVQCAKPCKKTAGAYSEVETGRQANECCDMGVCTLRYGMGQY